MTVLIYGQVSLCLDCHSGFIVSKSGAALGGKPSLPQGQLARVLDSFEIRTNMSYGIGYRESLAHILHIYADSLLSGNHNVTLFVYGAAPIARLVEASSGANVTWLNQTEPQRVNVALEGSYLNVELLLGTSPFKAFDPIDIYPDPYDAWRYSVSADGHLSFDLELTATEFMPACAVLLTTDPNSRFESFGVLVDLPSYSWAYGSYAQVSLDNVSTGLHRIHVDATVVGPENGNLGVSVFVSRNNWEWTRTELVLDGDLIEAEHLTSAWYTTRPIQTARGLVPWISGTAGRDLTCYNFSVDGLLQLRISDEDREHIAFLVTSQPPLELTVYADMSSRWVMDFRFPGPTAISLGLAVQDLLWFLRPTMVEQMDVSQSIWDQCYASWSYSPLMDVHSPLALLWVSQVKGNLTNPLLIAQALQRNVTASIQYDFSYAGRRMSLSNILLERKGVCEHIAEAFSGLCLAAGVPSRVVSGRAIGDIQGVIRVKNHLWSEVYLGPYEWVTVDPTWNEFNLLSGGHLLQTEWNYVDGTLSCGSVSQDEYAAAQNATIGLIHRLCSNARETMAQFPESAEFDVALAETLLRKADLLADTCELHDSLVALCAAYSTLEQAKPVTIISLINTCIAVVIVLVAAWFLSIRIGRRMYRGDRCRVSDDNAKRSVAQQTT